MSKSQYVLLFSFALFIFSSCSKEQQLKRKIDGKYQIKNFNSKWSNLTGCEEDNITYFSVNDPGEMVFTGKKTIDGPVSSASSRPYYGYLDYNFSTQNYFGDNLEFSERIYFQYEVISGVLNGSQDTVFAHIFFNGDKYNLNIIYEGNKVSEFNYNVNTGNNCLKGVESHIIMN